MVSTPEGRAKNAIKRYLKTIKDCWFFSPIGGPYSAHGVPDIVGLISGRFFAIEVKAPGKERNTTANQQRTIDEINTALGVAFVASSVDDVRKGLADGDFNVL
jgi:hypothetical protein